jgi:hypothetical protein
MFVKLFFRMRDRRSGAGAYRVRLTGSPYARDSRCQLQHGHFHHMNLAPVQIHLGA